MKIHNCLFNIVFGVGVSVLTYPVYAQQNAGGDADEPESAGEIMSQRPIGQKWKGFAPIPNSTITPSSSPRRQESVRQPSPGNERRGLQPLLTGQTFRSTNLIGASITNADGQVIGKVVDFVTDAQG